MHPYIASCVVSKSSTVYFIASEHSSVDARAYAHSAKLLLPDILSRVSLLSLSFPLRSATMSELTHYLELRRTLRYGSTEIHIKIGPYIEFT